MTDDNFDRKIFHLLQHWDTPMASENAVARILAAAQASPHAMPTTTSRKRYIFFVGPMAAAAMVAGVMTLHNRSTIPHNDPIMQQHALVAFSMPNPNADPEELLQ